MSSEKQNRNIEACENMHIEVKQTEEENHARFYLSGTIDEKVDESLSTIIPHLADVNVFNLRYIEEITSLGILHWMNFIDQISEDQKVIFHQCSPEFIMTMNMVPNFQGHAKIDSVIATYYCTECHHERDFIFEAGKNMPDSKNSEFFATDCDNCGRAKMEMYELEEEFFAFNFSEQKTTG